MRKICLIAIALFASTAAHAEPAPAPATTIFQTTNPQAQTVLKELQSHGLIQTQPTPQPASTAAANIVTLPAPSLPASSQPAQLQTVQAPVAQTQVASPQPVATVSQQPITQQPVSQPVAAPVTPSVTSAKPVVHTASHHDTDEAKARRIAARYGVHW